MAEVIESLVNFSGHLLVYRARYAYTAWFGQILNSCRQINAITINIVSVVYDFAQVDTNPELQALILGQFCVPRKHLTLEFDRGVDRCGNTPKLCQNGISRLMDFLATMRCNHISKQIEAGIKLPVGFLLIVPGKSAIAGNISIKNGGELAFHSSVSNTRGSEVSRRASSNLCGSVISDPAKDWLVA